ncbi:unnamed protein product [Oppiella nova]|uniref:IRS-type PTB domain-containing protein n=1 Tax=Oppiella nova TaxID=334625 RepID=A0A7R9M710_9ACAR|nr:unnamed protein product [Oppiella nova]CAG2171836.1 unnamed protein product [Oppiella nova]
MSVAGLVLERFQVCVLPTDASERACLRGQLQLVIFTRGVGVARVGDYECFLLWPIAFIRQYRHESIKNNKNNNNTVILSQSNNKCDKRQTVVTLEVGRRCSTGEGVFSFRTSNGQEVMRQLKRAITNWAQYKANCRSNSRFANTSTTPTTTVGHRSHRYSRSRSSAPCTPNMSDGTSSTSAALRAVTPSPRKQFKVRRGDTEPPLPVTTAPKLTKDKSRSISDDVNYVIPIFDDNEDNEDTQKSSDGEYINNYKTDNEDTQKSSDGEYINNYKTVTNKTYESCCRRRQSSDSCHRQRVSTNCHKSVASRSNSGNSTMSTSDDNRCVDSPIGGDTTVTTGAVEANPYLELIAT